jgi:hypothetical protein
MSGKEAGYTYAKLVTVSGDNGSSGSIPTNFTVNLGTNMQKVVRVSIASVTFPNNAYNVNSTGGGQNNTFAIIADGKTVDFSVEGGFYTTTSLMAAVATAINTYLTANGGGTVALTQDPISQIVSLSYTPSGTNPTITILDALEGAGIWELLGFNIPPNGSIGTSTVITATYLPSLGGLKEVFLQSSALAPGNMFDKDGEQKNTLLAIPITAPFGVSNVFECKVDALCEITYLSQRTLQSVDFSLTDKYGNIVDLHGGNLVINLKVWFNRF